MTSLQGVLGAQMVFKGPREVGMASPLSRKSPYASLASTSNHSGGEKPRMGGEPFVSPPFPPTPWGAISVYENGPVAPFKAVRLCLVPKKVLDRSYSFARGSVQNRSRSMPVFGGKGPEPDGEATTPFTSVRFCLVPKRFRAGAPFPPMGPYQF